MIPSQQLQRPSYSTFAQSTPFAQQTATLPQYVPSSQMQKAAYQQSPAVYSTVTALVDAVSDLTHKLKQMEQKDSKIYGIHQSHEQMSNEQIVCQLCGGSHNALKCYKFKNRQNSTYRPNADAHITCYTCNKSGHRSINCRVKRNNAARCNLNQ